MIDTLAKDIINNAVYDSTWFDTTEEQVESLITVYSNNISRALPETPNHTLRYTNLVLSKTRLTTALNNPIHKIVLYRKCVELLQLNSLEGIL